MCGAILWGAAMLTQLWSGGVKERSWCHKICGYGGYACLTVAVTSGGIIWTTLVDFMSSGEVDVGAGLYTYILSLCAWGNMTRAGAYSSCSAHTQLVCTAAVVMARRKDTAAHKDHAMMAMMW